MNRYVRIFFLLVTIFNLWLVTWFVRQGDVMFSSDIGRDFFILDEIRQKTVVLIGPRSSAPGFYHGVFWSYLTYPAFALGHGNPITVSWFYVALIIGVLIGYFFIAKKLFNELSAWLFVIFVSEYMVFQTHQLFHPYGAFFLFPFIFFCFIRYLKSHNIKFLLAHILLVGAAFQSELAVGAPLLILSYGYITYDIIRKKNFKHVLAYLLFAIPLIPYALFDIRHNFGMVHAGIRQLQQADVTRSFSSLIANRLDVMFTGIEFLRHGITFGSAYTCITFLIMLLYTMVKYPKTRFIYGFFLYFFVGYFALSLLNRYNLLYFYTFPIFLFVFLIFTSLVSVPSKVEKTIFLIFFSLIVYTNYRGIAVNINNWKTTFVGTSPYSWKALSEVANTVFTSSDNDFGYFVFSPDIMAYEPRYAMQYTSKKSNKTVHVFVKKPITYVITAPQNGTYMTYDWIKQKMAITGEPVETIHFPNGYTIYKHMLTPEEIAVPYDEGINPGLHYR